MRILMFGRGVIASLCGWALEGAGHEVEFYVRPGRAAEHGDAVRLDVLDTRRRVLGRRVVQEWPVRLREELGPDHDFDLIVLSVPHYRLTEAADFVAPRLGKASVLVFGNVWDEPDEALGDLPLDRVVWGFPQSGGGFGADGVLRGLVLPQVLFGTLDGPPVAGEQAERGRAARQAFREAGFKVRERPDFRGWLWLHFVADAGLHAQGLRLGSLSELPGRPDALREALLTVRELLPLVEARGVDLRRHRLFALLSRAPARPTACLVSLVLKHFPPARASIAAHSDPRAEEPRRVCQDALAQARRSGVAVPRLEAAEPGFARA